MIQALLLGPEGVSSPRHASPMFPDCCAAVTPLRCSQVGIFQVMLLGRSAAVAHAVVAPMEPFPAFRDASSGAPCFLLRIQHVLAVRPCRASSRRMRQSQVIETVPCSEDRG